MKNDHSYSVLGGRLRIARMRKGWSQTEVCKKLNIATSNLSGYERGQREPDIKRLAALADLYDVTTDWLVGRNEYATHNQKEIIKDPQLSYQL